MCCNICWSVAWINRTSPSKGVGLGSPLAACSVYGDLTLSVLTVNNFSSVSNYQTHVCLCIWGPYARLAFVPNMLSSWKKLLLLLYYVRLKPACAATEKLVRGLKFNIETRDIIQQQGADQTARMHMLICAFVVYIWHKQVFSWRGSNNDYTKKQ